tara:strand:- start:316 stop:4410 length:4095 start_codon:yes stop_codon:yes gene_type:complete
MPRIPKEADIKKYLIDADIIEERKEKQKSGLVINPLSTLRFTDPIGTAFLEAQRPDLFEKEGQVDLSKEIQRSGIDGLTRAIKGILEIPAAIIDGTANTNLTSKLDKVTRDFLQEHGNPKTFGGEIGSVLTQYGAPSTIAFKVLGNLGKLKKIRGLDNYLKNKFGKIYTKTAGSDLARRVGQGGLSLSAADFLVSDIDRPTLLVDKVPEEGKTGRDLAVARLANKIKFAQDGALVGGLFPIIGKGLSLGARFGLNVGAKTIGIGAKVADAVVINPASKLLARTPFLPQLASVVKSLPGKAREASGLPPFKEWRMFSVDNSDPLRRTLKRVDNFLSYLRSIGKQSPEQADVIFRGEKRIRAGARRLEKLLDSVEKRAYNFAKANQKYYDSLTTSPASRDRYLDEVLEFLKGQRPIEKVQKPLQATAKQLDEVLEETKKLYRDLLPDEKAAGTIKQILSDNLKGYMRKSFAVFTNPSYSVARSSDVFKEAVEFVKKIKDPDQKKRVVAKIRDNPSLTQTQAANEIAAENVESILRYAKTDNKDPIQILTSIAKKKLDMDKFIATGEEIPDVIRRLLGEEKNLRNTVLQTISTLSTSSTNKLMFDRLAEVLIRQKQLFRTRQQAERGLNIAREGGKIRRIPLSVEIPGVGLMKTKLSGLYGPADRVNQILTLKGPLDALAQMPVYKNFLQFKVAAQYGKTVLSPATQTRNFSSASFFVLNRGLLGGRASVTESIKMTVDDIFNAGKGAADGEKKLLDDIAEGIKYGALDENIVASELSAVLRAIRKGAIKDTDQLTGFLEKKGLLRTASRIYAGGDNVWKWYAYNWYKSFLRDYAKGDLGKMKNWFRDVAGQKFDPKDLLGKKKGLEEAIKEGAGWYVRNTMPTYSLVPRLIQAIRTLPFGNFVSFPAEMIRTTANTLRVNMREIASDDVVMREMGYRGAMGQFMSLGGASIATKKIYGALTGVTEDLMDAYKDYVAPDFQRNSDLIAVTKPVNGVFKVVDLSTFMPYDAVTRPIEAMFNAIRRQKQTPQSIDRFLLDTFFGKNGPIAELIAPFVNQTIAAETITEVLNNKKKEGGQIYSELDGFPETYEKSFKHILRSVEPGALTTARQAYYGFREKLTPTGQSYDLEDILFGLATGIKPLRIDLKRSADFIIGDLSKIRTEAPKTSPLYRKNMSRVDILNEYVNIQRNAFNEQARIYKAFEAMKDLSLPEKEIRKEIVKRKSNKKLGFKVLNGKFLPVNYSTPRFKDKIKEVERDITRRGRTPQLNRNDMFPKQKLNEIKRFLMNQDLNKIFPFDITTDPEPEQTTTQRQSSLPTELPVAPLPKTPTPINNVRTVAQINPNTGLTTTETALLSPGEQAIRLRQRT